MKCVFFLSLFCHVRYSTSQYAPLIAQRQPSLPCDSPNRNTLIEHFFNTIFTEFYSSPPLCVCVQMCAGQSTYCYPNGCLKTTKTVEKENPKRKDSNILPPQIQNNKNQFMLLKDVKNDFMAELLERYYPDDTKIASNNNVYDPPQDLRPDPFKDKYSRLGKFKRVPKIEFSYNLKDKLKTPKSEITKIEADLTNTRWPLNRHFRDNRIKMFPKVENPYVHTKFFTKMLTDHEVIAQYPPRYFKRDLTKTKEGDDVNIKAFYVLEDWFNATENKNFSLETLIDTLIRSSFGANQDKTTNLSITKRVEADIETKGAIEKVVSVNSTSLANETTSIISMNFTNENVDRNKYVDETIKVNETANLNEMITYLAKQIEKQNNTSMEIAKSIVNDFDETSNIAFRSNFRNVSTVTSPALYVEKSNMTENTSPTTHLNKNTESTPAQKVSVTKKNRQRVLRKLNFSKIN